MYINLNEAHDLGLDIRIEKMGKGGEPHLVIMPEDGRPLNTIQPIYEELKERGLTPAEAEAAIDRFEADIHCSLIFATLRGIDRSEP